jgi:hypothetical protein
MVQAKFVIVLMLGIVIQLSSPAASSYNTVSNVEHQKTVSQMDVDSESKDDFHCDESGSPASEDCCCLADGCADKCPMEAECNSANSPLVLMPFNTAINSPGYLQHLLSYRADVKQVFFDIYYPPK